MVAVTAYADKAMLWIEGESPPCLEISISSIANRFADAVLGEQPIAVQTGTPPVGPSLGVLLQSVTSYSRISADMAPKRGNGAQNQCRRESGHAVGVFQYGDRPQCTKSKIEKYERLNK